jgi:hypothetical protein
VKLGEALIVSVVQLKVPLPAMVASVQAPSEPLPVSIACPKAVDERRAVTMIHLMVSVYRSYTGLSSYCFLMIFT